MESLLSRSQVWLSIPPTACKYTQALAETRSIFWDFAGIYAIYVKTLNLKVKSNISKVSANQIAGKMVTDTGAVQEVTAQVLSTQFSSYGNLRDSTWFWASTTMFTYSKTKSNLLTVTFRYSCFKNFHPSFSSHFFFTLLPIPRVVFGNSNGLAVVDYIQKTVVLNLGTVELYGSNDPYQRQPRSPRKTRQPSGGNKKREDGSQKEKHFIHFSEHDSFFFFFLPEQLTPQFFSSRSKL